MLKIAKKTFDGKTIGYVVGYWFRVGYRWNSRQDRYTDRYSFRSIREGLIFKTENRARKFRDKIESERTNGRVQFEPVE